MWRRKNGITRCLGTSVSSPSPDYSRHNVHQRVSTRSEFMQRSWLRYPRLSITQAHTCNARMFMRTPPLSYVLRVSPLLLEVLFLIYFRVNLITCSLAMRRLKLLLFSFGIRLLVLSSRRSSTLWMPRIGYRTEGGVETLHHEKKLDFSLNLSRI